MQGRRTLHAALAHCTLCRQAASTRPGARLSNFSACQRPRLLTVLFDTPQLQYVHRSAACSHLPIAAHPTLFGIRRTHLGTSLLVQVLTLQLENADECTCLVVAVDGGYGCLSVSLAYQLAQLTPQLLQCVWYDIVQVGSDAVLSTSGCCDSECGCRIACDAAADTDVIADASVCSVSRSSRRSVACSRSSACRRGIAPEMRRVCRVVGAVLATAAAASRLCECDSRCRLEEWDARLWQTAVAGLTGDAAGIAHYAHWPVARRPTHWQPSYSSPERSMQCPCPCCLMGHSRVLRGSTDCSLKAQLFSVAGGQLMSSGRGCLKRGSSHCFLHVRKAQCAGRADMATPSAIYRAEQHRREQRRCAARCRWLCDRSRLDRGTEVRHHIDPAQPAS